MRGDPAFEDVFVEVPQELPVHAGLFARNSGMGRRFPGASWLKVSRHSQNPSKTGD
jgi:hypothetical protein